MKTIASFLFALAFVSFSSTPMLGEKITVKGNSTDAGVTQALAIDNGGSTNTESFRAGVAGGASNNGRAGVFVFQLPADLTAEQVVSVSFTATLKTIAGWYETAGMHFGVDLYALDARNASIVLGTDYYLGSSIEAKAGVTLIQQNFIPATPSSQGDLSYWTDKSLSTSTAGDLSLTSFVKEMLLNGAAGKYIFIRVSPNVANSYAATRGYDFYTADATNASFHPFLEISTIPEPASIALVASLCVLIGAFVFRTSRS